MVRPFRILIATTFSALLLAGCGDTAKLKSQIADLQQQLVQCQSDLTSDLNAKQAVIAQMSRQAAFAQACAWGIQICPDSIAYPANFSVEIGKKSFQIQPNPWLFYGLVALKFMIFIVLDALFVLSISQIYLWTIKPAKEDIDAARADIETAKDRVQEAKQEEQRIKTRAAKLKTELQSEIGALQDQAENLGEQRDALAAEVQELEELKKQAKAATNLLEAAFKPKNK